MNSKDQEEKDLKILETVAALRKENGQCPSHPANVPLVNIGFREWVESRRREK